MSDVLHEYCNFAKFKDDIVVDTNHCLQYVRQPSVNSEDIVFTVHITNKLLKQWEDLKVGERSNCISFVDILNVILSQKYAVLIKKESNRIEEWLRRLTSAAKSNSYGKKGSTFAKFTKQTKSIAIRSSEIVKTRDLRNEICRLKTSNKALKMKMINCTDVVMNCIRVY